MKQIYRQHIKWFAISCLFLPMAAQAQAQTATVYTPRGTAVTANIYPDFNSSQISQINSQAELQYPNAQRLSNASGRYNCHAYAWYLTEAPSSPPYWINDPNDNAYIQDGSYIQICNEAEAAKISYPTGDHSATRSGVIGKHDSKWGQYPVMRHDPAYTPAIYNPTVRTFYVPTKINTSTTNICGNIPFSVASFTGGSYSWTKSANINLSTTSGSSIVASNNGNGDGDGWIEVVISSSCASESITSRINLTVGGPTVPSVRWIREPGTCDYNMAFYSIDNYNPSFTYTISNRIQASGASIIGPNFWVKSGSGVRSGSFTLTVSNSCGSQSVDYDVSYPPCDYPTSTYTLSPNPATDELLVEQHFNVSNLSKGADVQISDKGTTVGISAVQVYDQYGRLRLTQSGQGTTVHLQLHTLPVGLYVVYILQDQKVVSRQQLQVRH